MLQYVEPILAGSLPVLMAHAATMKVAPTLQKYRKGRRIPKGVCAVVELGQVGGEAVQFGRITREGGAAALAAVETGLRLITSGTADALVTAPVSKEAISRTGTRFSGHTEYLAHRLDSGPVIMMLVADDLRVGLVTGHVSVRAVADRITQEAIGQRIRAMASSLRRDYGIDRPRIAVLGLNPHAGDGGVIGGEEQDVIVPAIESACRGGCFAFGPFSADGFFGAGTYRQYDAVLAMYHDQGLIPFKTLSFGRGANHTAGLPIVRTSPDHGTAYDIAGQGKASASSMRTAIFLARDIARRRQSVDEPCGDDVRRQSDVPFQQEAK